MRIEQSLKTRTTNNDNKSFTDTFKNTYLNTDEPIFFDLAPIAGLFFKDEYVNALLKDNLLIISNLNTKGDEPNCITIELSLATCDFYKLRVNVWNLRGDEYITIYDEVINLDICNLKKWLHIVLCDEIGKRDLIKNLPENYSFKPLGY